MTWSIIIGIAILLITFRLYRFGKYMKKYLVPYEIRIISNEKDNEHYDINFVAQFGRGYFKREYFMVIGNFKSKREFSLDMLKEMLSLTEIKLFYEGVNLKSGDIEHKYTYIRSLQEASDKDYNGEYFVTFTIVDQAGLDFAKSRLES